MLRDVNISTNIIKGIDSKLDRLYRNVHGINYHLFSKKYSEFGITTKFDAAYKWFEIKAPISPRDTYTLRARIYGGNTHPNMQDVKFIIPWKFLEPYSIGTMSLIENIVPQNTEWPMLISDIALLYYKKPNIVPDIDQQPEDVVELRFFIKLRLASNYVYDGNVYDYYTPNIGLLADNNTYIPINDMVLIGDTLDGIDPGIQLTSIKLERNTSSAIDVNNKFRYLVEPRENINGMQVAYDKNLLKDYSLVIFLVGGNTDSMTALTIIPTHMFNSKMNEFDYFMDNDQTGIEYITDTHISFYHGVTASDGCPYLALMLYR